MDYQDLPVEERISRAAQYAVLLVGDNKDSETIVSELKPMFHLTHEEAWEAYHKMRKEHAGAFNETIKTNNYNLLGGMAATGLIGAFYFFLGTDAGKNGLGFGAIALAIVAALGVLGSLGILARNLLEKYNRPRAGDPPPRKLLGAGTNHAISSPTVFVMLGALFAFLGSTGYIMDSGVVEERELITLPPQVLWKKPWEGIKKSSRGKKHHRYYFSFFENPHLYEFEETYYNHRTASYFLSDLQQGDTIAIQLDQADADLVNERYTSHTISIYNVVKNGEPYLDHAARNRSQQAHNKEMMKLGWYGFGICVVIAVIWSFVRRSHYTKLTTSRANKA